MNEVRYTKPVDWNRGHSSAPTKADTAGSGAALALARRLREFRVQTARALKAAGAPVTPPGHVVVKCPDCGRVATVKRAALATAPPRCGCGLIASEDDIVAAVDSMDEGGGDADALDSIGPQYSCHGCGENLDPSSWENGQTTCAGCGAVNVIPDPDDADESDDADDDAALSVPVGEGVMHDRHRYVDCPACDKAYRLRDAWSMPIRCRCGQPWDTTCLRPLSAAQQARRDAAFAHKVQRPSQRAKATL